MKSFISIFLVLLVTIFSVGCVDEPVERPDELVGVSHFKQATIRMEGDLTIYFDPYQYSDEAHDADVIFITHSHSDHFSPAAIAKVSNDDTVIVAPESMEQNVADLGLSEYKTVMPGMQYSVKGLSFETTYAYNTGSFARHAKSSNWVGYVVTMGDTRYYIAGDTDFIPEMESVEADVVFLPVGGGSSMDAATAASAAEAIMPAIAVPIHYGYTTGTMADAEQFVELLPASIDGYIYSDAGALLPSDAAELLQ